MTNAIVHDAPPTAQPVVVVQESDGLDMAWTWGHEDATEGIDQRGSWYWWPGTQLWHQYNAGYTAAVAKMLAGLDWNQDFSDVVPAEWRDDYVGM